MSTRISVARHRSAQSGDSAAVGTHPVRVGSSTIVAPPETRPAPAVEPPRPVRRTSRVVGRVVAAALAFLAVAVVGAVVADVLEPAQFRVGPHRAELRLTFTRAAVIDLGPLGQLSKSSGLGVFGYEITVKEIPRDRPGAPALSLEDYVRLYTDEAQIRANAERAMLRHSLRGALAAEILVIAGIIGLRALLGPARRRELATLLRERRVPFVIATSVVIVAFVTVYLVDVAPRATDGRASPILSDTPLAGVSVQGELLRVLVDEYGPTVAGLIRENDAFYDEVAANLRRAHRNGVPLTGGPDTETLMVAAGLHCNLGMATVIGRAVDRWDPAQFVTAGDDAIGAAAIDATCINSLAYHLRGTRVIAAAGDHDSSTALAAMRRHGFTVLEGELRRSGGLVVLGDTDPRVAVPAAGLVPRRDETVTEMGQRLADVACDSATRVDLVVANEPGAIRDTARSGCARMVIAGTETGAVLRTTSSGRPVAVALAGTSGGAAPNTITVGPLQAPAELLVVELSRETHQPLRYQRVRFFPDASVVVEASAAFLAAPVGVP
jgi:hypothetical protein